MTKAIKSTDVIKVTIRNVYGNVRVYPACDTSKAFTRLTNTATLGENDISTIKSLGYSVETIADKPSWI